jgi:hypothetical protein
MARTMEHQSALLLGRLGWHEPHIGPGDRFTNRLSVGHIVLLPFDVRLHVRWRHQPHGVAECLQLARPMCDEAQASMPTRHGGSFSKKAKT